MASKILNILSRTTEVSAQDLLQGVVRVAVTAVESAERQYDKIDKYAILEMLDFMSEIIAEHPDVSKNDDLVLIVDEICLALLPSTEAFVFGSGNRLKGVDAQLYQSICRLLSLCTITGSTSDGVISRLQKDCLSALMAYKEETDLISGGTGAQMTSDKHLSIHTAMEIINSVCESHAESVAQGNTHYVISYEWIQDCFVYILNILETSQANVCSRLMGVIVPKILETELDCLRDRCGAVWDKVCGIYSSSAQTSPNTNVFIALCGLVNYLMPCHTNSTVRESTNSFSVVPRIDFWNMVRSGLVHTDPLSRKQAMFLLKRAIDWCSSSGLDVAVQEEGDMLLLFQWTSESSKPLLGIWADFFLLYEALEEVQVHVVKPVLPRLDRLIKAASEHKTTPTMLHSVWLTVIFHRSFVHETKTVVKWGVSQFLQLDLTTCPIMHREGIQFVLHSVLGVLLDDGLYIRQPGTLVGICPSTVSDFKAFLKACVKVLPAVKLKVLLHGLLETVCNKVCGPVSLAFIMETLSELPSVPAWDQQSIKAIREFVAVGLVSYKLMYRSIIQCFLLRTTLNLVDTKDISLAHFSELLNAFNSAECLERGKTTWNEVCEWVLTNSSTQLFNPEGTTLQNTLSKNLVELLSVQDTSEGNTDLPNSRKAERVARLLVLLADTHQISLERGNPLFQIQTANNTSSVLADLLLPLSDVLCRLSSHIYLSQAKADRALQLLMAILKELQPQSVLFGNEHDPTRKDLEDLMIQCTEEVLTYLTRKLLSLQILQTGDMERGNFYISILDTIYTFWQSRFSISTQGSYQQLSVLLRNTKQELIKTTLNNLNLGMTQKVSVEKQGKKVAVTKMLLWLCNSSGVNSISKTMSVELASLLAIQSTPIKTLPLSQNAELVSSQDWGRIQSHLLQCKWSCICLLLEARITGAKEDFDTLNIFEMCVTDLELVSRSDVLPIMGCATMLIEQVASDNVGICIDFIEASWCLVQDKWRSLDFWPVYSAFVKLTFHNCFLQSRADTVIAETVRKYKVKIFELGQRRIGMVSILISHVINTWTEMLTDSEERVRQVVAGVTEHTEILIDACLFGPVCNKGERLLTETASYFLTLDQLDVVKHHILARGTKDSGVVRATVVNFLLKLGRLQREDLNVYLCNFVMDLLHKEQDLRKPYIINSLIHRQKQRTWQTVLVLMPYVQKDTAEPLYDTVMAFLVAENQTSVRYLMEWTLVLLLYRFPDLHSNLWQDLHVLFDRSKGNICPLLIVAAQLAGIQPTDDQKESFYMKAIPVVMPWSLAQPQSLRTHGQLALYKLWKDCTDQGLTRVLQAFPAVTICMEFTQNHSTLIRLKEKIEQYFFAIHFHPIEDYSIQTIFHTLPGMSYVVEEELLDPSIFEQESPHFWSATNVTTQLQLRNSRTTLEEHRQLQLQFKAAEVKAFKADLHDKDVQKKIQPSKDIPGLEGLVSDEAKSKGSLVLVASLIDKPTNLGGLCRTSEIFGVSKLVLGSYRYVEDKQFTTLSVTAEKWLPIEEVKPNDLKKYLGNMRHAGYTLVGVEQTANSTNLTEYRFPERTLLLLGNERGGIPVELIQLLDTCVEIPQLGVVRSLNVHVSGALLVWEYTRQRLLNC